MPAGGEHIVDWRAELTGAGIRRERALRRLHSFVLGAAYTELRRQLATEQRLTGVEFDDLAHQAADDALMAVLAKLDEFRGESLFTTWAYAFVVREVATRLRRHSWLRSPMPAQMDDVEWGALPDSIGTGPAESAVRRGLVRAVRHAVDTELSSRQRQVFDAVVVDGVAPDTLSAQLGTNRNAVHQTMFVVRRKLRRALQVEGYLPA
jgi:RNA polymerase sigma-70 factor (ECF subfamily)